jgi:prephenate dehydrogenase
MTKLTIVGLDVVGTSLGMALKVATAAIPITGHDPDAERVARAKRLKAIDRSHWNLLAACEQADIILFDLPLAELEKTLTALRDDLPPNVVLLDTLPLKRPVMELARRVLPPGAAFLGGHVQGAWQRATPGGEPEPAAEALRGVTVCLVVPEEAPAWALDKISNLVEAVGAKPCFTDAAEHDGLLAADAQLAAVAAVALAQTLASSPGPHEGATPAAVVSLATLAALGATPELLAANADNLRHWLAAYQEALRALDTALAAQDRDALRRALEEATRATAPPAAAQTLPGASSMWRDMFVGSLGRRRY